MNMLSASMELHGPAMCPEFSAEALILTGYQQRKPEPEDGSPTGPGAVSDLASPGLHGGPAVEETQSDAARVTRCGFGLRAALQPRKALKESRLIRLRNTWPTIQDLDLHRTRFLADLDLNQYMPSRRRKTPCIVE